MILTGHGGKYLPREHLGITIFQLKDKSALLDIK
jgi:hypothetical protein